MTETKNMIAEAQALSGGQLEKNAAAYKRLLAAVAVLRAEGGCPWDLEQTPLSMRSDLLEETFEAVDALSEQDAAHAKEELGDVILNASIISYMFEQGGDFTVADCLDALTDKLIRRHPHVFTDSEGQAAVTETAGTAEEVLTQWDRIKENVERRKGGESVLDDVPKGFPPLLRAYKLQKKAAKKGFDWKDLAPVYDKVREELTEVKEAADAMQKLGGGAKAFTVGSTEERNQAQLHTEEEVGDLLFAVVNYARHLGVDPVTALSRANEKFYRRFTFVEREMTKTGTPMDGEHLADMDCLWNKAKRVGL
ncbi:MAG: nucleoside triphosphate pyrophosphohydrolase [Treponema sp.]